MKIILFALVLIAVGGFGLTSALKQKKGSGKQSNLGAGIEQGKRVAGFIGPVFLLALGVLLLYISITQ